MQPPAPTPRLSSSAIVRYLDHADRRIRRYVSAKRKLITLLEEEKQAVINRAVTRGLDPNVRLKPSGVEWLGDVPEHWEVRQASINVRSIIGMAPNGGLHPIQGRRSSSFLVRSQTMETPDSRSVDR